MKNLKKLPSKIALAVGLASVILPLKASAYNRYPGEIPNGTLLGCIACHFRAGGGGPRNNFGLDVGRTVQNGSPNWPALYDLDSDGDGQTNGEELGDPCGDWTSGTAPRTTDVSLPGDNTDTSADANTPSCGGLIVEDAGLAGAGNGDSPFFETDGGAGDAGNGDSPLFETDGGAEDAGIEQNQNVACTCTDLAARKTPLMGLLAFMGLFFFVPKKAKK